jgi:hypothetical protein
MRAAPGGPWLLAFARDPRRCPGLRLLQGLQYDSRGLRICAVVGVGHGCRPGPGPSHACHLKGRQLPAGLPGLLHQNFAASKGGVVGTLKDAAPWLALDPRRHGGTADVLPQLVGNPATEVQGPSLRHAEPRPTGGAKGAVSGVWRARLHTSCTRVCSQWSPLDSVRALLQPWCERVQDGE